MDIQIDTTFSDKVTFSRAIRKRNIDRIVKALGAQPSDIVHTTRNSDALSRVDILAVIGGREMQLHGLGRGIDDAVFDLCRVIRAHMSKD